MKHFALLLLIPLILLSLVGVWFLEFPLYIWRQKLTIVVETPDGVRSGSSVTNHLVQLGPISGLEHLGSSSPRIHGEATVVDLGDGRFLFALLKDNSELTQIAFSEQMPSHQADYKSILNTIIALEGVADVPLPDAPQLVTFSDVSDPASLLWVDPADLTATFGTGFVLREITLEVTNHVVTEGVVEGVLEWITEHRGKIKLAEKLYEMMFHRKITFIWMTL